MRSLKTVCLPAPTQKSPINLLAGSEICWGNLFTTREGKTRQGSRELRVESKFLKNWQKPEKAKNSRALVQTVSQKPKDIKAEAGKAKNDMDLVTSVILTGLKFNLIVCLSAWLFALVNTKLLTTAKWEMSNSFPKYVFREQELHSAAAV